MGETAEVRIDKFLWSVRIYKTRSLATDACKKGRIIINKVEVKASRNVLIGDIIHIKMNPITRQYKVIQLLHNRVGAKLVANYIEEVTPAEELEKLAQIKEFEHLGGIRERGAGRPTKKERRQLDDYFDF